MWFHLKDRTKNYTLKDATLRHAGKPRILFVDFFRYQNFLKLKLPFWGVYFVPFFGH